MIHYAGHDHPVAFNDESKLVLVDTCHPMLLPPEFDNDEQREGARRAAAWFLELLEPKGASVKIAALRFAFGLERKTMQEVGNNIGVTRAAISRHRTIYADRFGLAAGKSNRARLGYSHRQRKIWEERRKQNGAVK